MGRKHLSVLFVSWHECTQLTLIYQGFTRSTIQTHDDTNSSQETKLDQREPSTGVNVAVRSAQRNCVQVEEGTLVAVHGTTWTFPVSFFVPSNCIFYCIFVFVCPLKFLVGWVFA